MNKSDAIMELTLPGRVPSKKNLWKPGRNRKTGKSNVYIPNPIKNWLLWAKVQLASQVTQCIDPAHVHLIFYQPNFQQDGPNLSETIYDLLGKIGAITSDNMLRMPKWSGEAHKDTVNPRTIIRISHAK